MVYKGYLIEPDKSGYAPKDSQYFIFELDAEVSCGFGESIEDCKDKIDEMLKNEKEETWSRWCNLCEMMSTFSNSNPYGTCQCS